MNLETDIRDLRTRIAQPVRANPDDGFLTDLEAVGMLNFAALRVAQDIVDDALPDLHQKNDQTTISGQENYSVPSDLLRILSVEIDYGQGFNPAQLVSPKELILDRWDPVWRAENTRPNYAVLSNEIFIRPIPDSVTAGATRLRIRYIQTPARRFKHLQGKTDGDGTTTVLAISTDASPSNWWVGTTPVPINARIQSGVLAGEERTVSASSKDTNITVSVVYSAIPGTGIIFDVGEESPLSKAFQDLMMGYAAYLGWSKDENESGANREFTLYTSAVKGINARYNRLHAQEPHSLAETR